MFINSVNRYISILKSNAAGMDKLTVGSPCCHIFGTMSWRNEVSEAPPISFEEYDDSNDAVKVKILRSQLAIVDR